MDSHAVAGKKYMKKLTSEWDQMKPSRASNITSNSCNMGTSDLPDMYAQSLRAEGMHIRQSRVPMLQLICDTFLANCAQAKR